MTAKLIDGKLIAKKFKGKLKSDLEQYAQDGFKQPHLAVVIVGEDPASQSYVRAKVKACKKVGMNSTLVELDSSTNENKLLEEINKLNNNDDIDGILVQLPLPKSINTQNIFAAIDLEKDVDGFHPINVGNLKIGLDNTPPCTPKGIMALLKETKIDVAGKNVVVIGRSNIVGKPMARMLIEESATVTVCHSKTKDVKAHTLLADIIIVAVGKINLLTEDMVKPGAVIIDVGINRTKDGNLCGDVDFENVKEVASHITPVPGGVGPMTITELLFNTFKCAKRRGTYYDK